MGWIITTILLFVLCVGIVWFASHVILNMYNKQRQFEDELEEKIDSSLQVLDSCFMEIALIANKPIFFDSPEVRAVIAAIQRSRQAVIHVAEIFKEIDVEDKTTSVTPKIVEYVSQEDPHNPKSAKELDAETKNEMIKKAVRDGNMEILEPPERRMQQITTTPGAQKVDHRLATVLARRQSKMK